MSFQYDQYLAQHRSNVKRGYEWLCENLPDVIKDAVNGKSHTYYTAEVYWSWDYVRSEDKTCKEVSYLKHIFSSKKIQLPDDDYIDTLKESSHVRFKYYGVGLKYTGTIFTELKNKTIKNNSPFYENMTIDETVDHLESDFALWLFWIFWIILIGAYVYGFYYLDNEWLE